MARVGSVEVGFRGSGVGAGLSALSESGNTQHVFGGRNGRDLYGGHKGWNGAEGMVAQSRLGWGWASSLAPSPCGPDHQPDHPQLSRHSHGSCRLLGKASPVSPEAGPFLASSPSLRHSLLPRSPCALWPAASTEMPSTFLPSSQDRTEASSPSSLMVGQRERE